MKTTLSIAVRKLITDESGMVRAEHAILLSMLALSTLTAITNVTRASGMPTWHAR
jgi:Flp pilus assembly pilin Flp